MERRNRALESFKEFLYIDSLDGKDKADRLNNWISSYIIDNEPFYLYLTKEQQQLLSELYHKNILFLKNYNMQVKNDMDNIANMRKFIH